MQVRTLSQFIAVAEERSIGRAAIRLQISQSALTRKIHSLEEEVGIPLFTRSISGVEMTRGGEILLNHAREIMAEIAVAKREVLSVAKKAQKN